MRACPSTAPGRAPATLALVLGFVLVVGPLAAATAMATPAFVREQAFAALWNEDTPTAITLFREYLATPDGAADREAQRGLALACSWDGRQGEAATLYRSLLATDPADGDSQVGLGRALLWDNRLREGWRELDHAASGGTPATAGSARDVMLTALDEYTPPWAAGVTATWDSDDLHVVRAGVTATLPSGGALIQLMPSHAWYRQPGQPDVDATRLGVGLVTGLGARTSLHAYGWLDRFASDGDLPATTAPLDWDQAGGDAWLTWLPAPRWRVDLGAGAQPVETFLALGNHLVRRQGSLSVEHRLAKNWSAGVSGVAGDYSDGNRSDRLTVRVGWLRDGRWRWQVGPVANYLDFRVPYPGGYWAPADMRSGGLEASVRTRGRNVTLRLAGSIAQEKEAGADALTVGGGSARVGWRFAPDWLLAVEGGKSQSSFGSASGYRRTSLTVDVRAYF